MPQLRRLSVVPAGVLIGLVPIVLSRNPAWIRMAFALLIVAALALVSLVNPRLSIVLTLCLLPFLAMIRRVLIPVAGWTSYDPLLLLAPVLAASLLYRVFIVEKRRLAADWVSGAVVVVMVLAIIQVVNPEGGGIAAGATGLLFIAAPLAWFFVGRELADEQLVRRLLAGVVFIAAGIAIYGLWQSLVGLLPWDSAWVDLNGYTSLNVFGATRAFGTFSSGAEYAFFLAIALVISVVMALRGRPIALIFTPVLACAIFLESSRTIIFVILLTLVGVIGLRTGSRVRAVLALGLFIVLAVSTIRVFGPQLTAIARQTGSPLILHQVQGLMNPFDASQSTLQLHQQLVTNGFLGSLAHPLGFGTASTNLAGQKAGATTNSAEVDYIDAFVSLGLIGGAAFLTIVLLSLWRSASLGLSKRSLTALGAAAILVVTFGQWLNGGYYALSPVVWLVVGWTNKEWLAAHRRAPSIPLSATSVERLIGSQPRQAAGWFA